MIKRQRGSSATVRIRGWFTGAALQRADALGNDGLEGVMPIYRLFEEHAFQPEHCQAMGIAFERVLAELGLSNRSDPLCELVARKVVELGQQGIDDPQQLRQLALTAIGK
jgi:hypothetical protein